jgi:membrane protein implicated in regulation of membrane protease activity
MSGLYLFAAAAGVPLLVWMLFAGGDEGGADDGASADGAGGESGIGGLMLRILPLSTIAIVSATFGICGLALQAADIGSLTTLVAAGTVAVVSGVLNSALFAYLRGSESTASVADDQLVGKVGRVVLPTRVDRRGRVVVSTGSQPVHLSALASLDPDDHDLEVGATVVVIEVRNGVATVSRIDPELT